MRHFIASLFTFFSFSVAAYAQNATNQDALVSSVVLSDSSVSSALVQSEKNIAEARRLFADSIPEDRFKIDTLLNDAIRLNPRSEEAFSELGRYLTWQVATGVRSQADLYVALEFADHVKDLAPNRPLGDFLRCETLNVMNRLEEAKQICSQTELKFPNHIDTHIFRARYYAETAPNIALESAQKALAQGAQSDIVSLFVATAIAHNTGAADQGNVLSNFAELYPDRWLWHRAALAFAAEKRPNQAKEAFQKAIDLGNILESRLQLALLEATQLNQHSQAIREYETVLELLKTRSEPHTDVVASIHARMAIVYLEDSKISNAISQASQAITEDVTDTPLIQALYETFAIKKLGEKLAPALSVAAGENPFFAYAHMTLGDLAAQRKDFTESLTQYTKVVALFPDEDFPYVKRAHSQYSLKNYLAALQDFDRALEIHPENARHHYNRSCMLALLGKNDDAIKSLRTAVALDPKLAALAINDSDLRGLSNSEEYKYQMAALRITPQLEQTPTTAATEHHGSE